MIGFAPGVTMTCSAVDLEALPGRDVRGDRLAERRHAEKRRVVGPAVVERALRCLAHVGRRVEIRLADLEVDDVSVRSASSARARAATSNAVSVPIVSTLGARRIVGAVMDVLPWPSARWRSRGRVSAGPEARPKLIRPLAGAKALESARGHVLRHRCGNARLVQLGAGPDAPARSARRAGPTARRVPSSTRPASRRLPTASTPAARAPAARRGAGRGSAVFASGCRA